MEEVLPVFASAGFVALLLLAGAVMLLSYIPVGGGKLRDDKEFSMFGLFKKKKPPPAPAVKDLLIARKPPWDRVRPTVINAIIEAIRDKGLLEAFVMHSMNEGLVKRYERLGGDDPKVIGAQISHILCEVGNRAVPSVSEALTAKQQEAAIKPFTLAMDAFEAAIALANNQNAAYVGIATLYAFVGKREKCLDYAKRGLAELSALRTLQPALQRSEIFPPDILDQAERQLRGLLEYR